MHSNSTHTNTAFAYYTETRPNAANIAYDVIQPQVGPVGKHTGLSRPKLNRPVQSLQCLYTTFTNRD